MMETLTGLFNAAGGVEMAVKAGLVVILAYVLLRFFIKMVPMLLVGAGLVGVVYFFGMDQFFNAVVLFVLAVIAARWLYEIGLIATDVLSIWVHWSYLPMVKFCLWYRQRRRDQLKIERLALRHQYRYFEDDVFVHAMKMQTSMACSAMAGGFLLPMLPDMNVSLIEVMLAIGVMMFLMLEHVHHNPFAAAWNLTGKTLFYGYRTCRI